MRRGEKAYDYLATYSKIPEIVEQLRLGITQDSLAKRFGVARATIWRIASGKTWIKVLDGR